MGGALALHTALRWDRNLAGVFAFSSFLNDKSIVFKELRNNRSSDKCECITGLKFHIHKIRTNILKSISQRWSLIIDFITLHLESFETNGNISSFLYIHIISVSLLLYYSPQCCVSKFSFNHLCRLNIYHLLYYIYVYIQFSHKLSYIFCLLMCFSYSVTEAQLIQWKLNEIPDIHAMWTWYRYLQFGSLNTKSRNIYAFIVSSFTVVNKISVWLTARVCCAFE